MGVGNELHRLLESWGFKERKGCKCKKYRDRMNRKGADWCESKLSLCLRWLKRSAEEQTLPFSRHVAVRFLRRAIRNARRKG